MDNKVCCPTSKSDISVILGGIRLSESFYAMSQCYGPWGFRNPPGAGAIFHYLVKGKSLVETADGVIVKMEEGDLVLLTKGYNHILKSEKAAPLFSLESLGYERTGPNSTKMHIGTSGSGELTIMVCGGVMFEPAWHPLFESFPRIINFRHIEQKNAVWSKALVDLMGMEVSRGLPGSEAIITRLIEVLVIGAIRDWMLYNVDDTSGWIMALRDNNLGHALASLHDKPGKNWTVATLAEKAAMSRTSFAERFNTLIGLPPMHYLLNLRMHIAGDLLRNSNFDIAKISKEIAYGSEISFSRAFKKYWGKPPGAYRKQPILSESFNFRNSN